MNDWVTLAQGARQIRVRQRDVNKLLGEGWNMPGADRVIEEESQALPSIIDAGIIKTKAPKKKAVKAAEQAPEAAEEDLGNDISKGEL